jgi:hypothetical protein
VAYLSGLTFGGELNIYYQNNVRTNDTGLEGNMFFSNKCSSRLISEITAEYVRCWSPDQKECDIGVGAEAAVEWLTVDSSLIKARLSEVNPRLNILNPPIQKDIHLDLCLGRHSELGTLERILPSLKQILIFRYEQHQMTEIRSLAADMILYFSRISHSHISFSQEPSKLHSIQQISVFLWAIFRFRIRL